MIAPKIILINESDGFEVEFEREFTDFSKFLNIDSLENIYVIPRMAEMDSKFIKIIKDFLEIHHYKLANVKFETSYNNQLKAENLSAATTTFIEKIKDADDQTLMGLIQASLYLQVELLESVLYSYLSVKYGASLVDSDRKKQFEEFKVEYLSMESLKKEYADFFRNYGSCLLE